MALLGSKKRILMVGGEGVALFGPTARGIEREAALSWEVPDFDTQLVEALTEQNRGYPVLILFDGADQTYRKEENIPKLAALDRARYIKRKLDQAFPSYPVRASTMVKPKDGEPFYLFVALPETDRLDAISADMMEAGTPISGFGLLPAESVGLVKTLAGKVFTHEGGAPSRWAVLISQHETGGLRQVVVRDGNLALTRITPTSEAGVHGPGWAEEVMREFKATLTYIARFGYTAEEGLDVMVICSSIDKQFFSDKTLPVTNFQCLTLTEALSAIGSKGVGLGETNFGDALHAAWAARKRALSVPIVVPSIHRIMVPRMVARLASVALTLLFFALGFFVSGQYSEYGATQQEVSDRTRQKELLEQEYAQESRIFEAYPIKPHVVKSVLAVKQLVDDSTVNIAPTLNLLRAALDNDIRLDSLSFAHDATGMFNAASGLPDRTTITPAQRRGSVTVNFRFGLIGGLTLEQKVQRAEGLVKILQEKFPGYDVRIASQFGNISRTGSFAGESGQMPLNADGTPAPPPSTAPEDQKAEIEMTGPPL
jgi:hypothetical protein